jgi:Zn-dependent M16 (insulinase) family peptidase
MLIIIKFLYKSKKNDLIKEIDKKEFKEFKENVFNKYNGENKYNYENKTLEGIFIKIEQAKELLDKRFSFSSIIKDRIKDLMFDYLNLAIKNFDLIKDMRKTAENALCRENDEISKNLDNLIREFFIDQKGEDNISELNESLLRSLELFERMRKK